MIDILLMVTVISLWCCGFRAITDQGMIGYWMRWPFETDDDGVMNLFKPYINAYKKRKNQPYPDVYLDATKRHTVVLQYVMKPLILCVTCMASVHGLLAYWILTLLPLGIEFSWLQVLIVLVPVAFVNSISWTAFEKLRE